MYKTPSPRKPDLIQPFKKLVLSAFVVFTFVVYAIHDRLTGSDSEALNQGNIVPQPSAAKTTSPKGSGGNPAGSVVVNVVTPTTVQNDSSSQPTAIVIPTFQPAATNPPVRANRPAPTAPPK